MAVGAGPAELDVVEQFLAHEQRAGTLGAEQPLVAAGGIAVAAERTEIGDDTAGALRAVEVVTYPAGAQEASKLRRFIRVKRPPVIP